MSDDEDEDLPEHVKRAVRDARRVMDRLPRGVLEQQQRVAEAAQRFLGGVPRDLVEQHQRAMDAIRRTVGSLPHDLVTQHQRAMEDIHRMVTGVPRPFLEQYRALRAATEPPYRELVRQTFEAQRHILGGLSASSVFSTWTAKGRAR